MRKIEISEIQIIPVKPDNGLLGFCSFVVNGSLYVGDVGIYNAPARPEGYRLVYPDKVLRTGKRINVVHPITKEAGDLITRAVVEEYKKLQRKIFRSEEKNSEEVVTNGERKEKTKNRGTVYPFNSCHERE